MAQEFYKKIYTVKEGYVALYKGLRTYKYLKRNKKNKQMSSHFIERIMLAVTEVNGCEVCAYGHTKIALEQGMSDQEIQMLLSGAIEGAPDHEVKAIIFAQHYADTKGNPTKESWDRIVEAYGTEKALGILGAIRMIMIGNSYGIAISALKSRMKGKPIEKTGFLYEIRMILSLIVSLPVAMIHSFILNIFKVPVIDF
ncbi:carboxymuconolactone decarboxylase family protein [Hazenella coriacea]|uniref:AhpD family alkylhydroperoxidase n=1 Tax=Hazenella coriacea TaxID=1179467 RepID=A0A4V6NZA2_9BACL|nr:carboxymuconolactone decarboxylase family protein [Hazenella coriacea]TCS95877.1 AhpD family alkylhydroperoxidase [Hazenella coriacea]